MYERFTGRVRQAMESANRHARKSGSDYITVEHILLGLLDDPPSGGRRVLQKCGVSVDALRLRVNASIAASPTPGAAKHVISSASEEARALGGQHVGTEHLLIGIMRTEECAAYQLLSETGVNLADVRRLVREMHAPSDSRAERET